MRTSINPPPPMLPAAGSTTAKAKAVATAASIALPPFCRISTPARDASSSSVATMPCAPRTACLGHTASDSVRSLYSAAVCALRGNPHHRIAPIKSAHRQTELIFILGNDTTKLPRQGQDSERVFLEFRDREPDRCELNRCVLKMIH